MTISPGWYKDPADPSTQRYWDGEGWVGAALPADAVAPDGPPEPEPAPPPPPPPVVAPQPGGVSSSRDGVTPPVFPPPPFGTGPGGGPGARPLPPGWPHPVPTTPVRPHGMPLASPGVRLGARLVDFLAVLGLNIVVNGWFVYLWLREFVPYMRSAFQKALDGGQVTDVARPAQLDGLFLVIIFIALGLWFAYEVPATAHSGQTFGKRIMRIKVVPVENLQPLGMGRAWRRWTPLALPLLLIPCCLIFFVIPQILDVVLMLMDRRQRMAWHDRSAGTYVVQLPDAARPKKRGA
ncbi:RDD family protein [Catellatospora sp. KI3]|uniref:RDD family protein n=1 Tax=Catellatospora sp. KI3 TaxID=3041620 RepID=UPI0024832D78|nr:RDD family protein [Catellatospora sp. KI3]MDI1466252.1 RDD family protein [Catellatospora sp. KI3]